MEEAEACCEQGPLRLIGITRASVIPTGEAASLQAARGGRCQRSWRGASTRGQGFSISWQCRCRNFFCPEAFFFFLGATCQVGHLDSYLPDGAELTRKGEEIDCSADSGRSFSKGVRQTPSLNWAGRAGQLRGVEFLTVWTREQILALSPARLHCQWNHTPVVGVGTQALSRCHTGFLHVWGPWLCGVFRSFEQSELNLDRREGERVSPSVNSGSYETFSKTSEMLGLFSYWLCELREVTSSLLYLSFLI